MVLFLKENVYTFSIYRVPPMIVSLFENGRGFRTLPENIRFSITILFIFDMNMAAALY